MLKNLWNTPKIVLFGQTTKATVNHLSPENVKNIGNFEGWALVAFIRKSVISIYF